MNEQSQASDRLRSIVSKAREETPVVGLPVAGETAAKALVDKNAALPDPLALARLYQSEDLQTRLPEDAAEAEQPGPRRAQGWEQLPPVASRSSGLVTPADSLLNERDSMARPSMTPAEMRAVMAELQERFQVTDRSYETYEMSRNPVDDVPVGMTREEREAQAAAELKDMEEVVKGTWLYFLGAGMVVVVIVVFIILATSGPFKPPPPPPATPSPATSAAHA